MVERGLSTYAKIKAETGHDWMDMQAQAEQRGTALKAGRAATGGTRNPSGAQPHLEPASSATTGWQPTCACDAATQPCLVLDPFMGSGTTALVAWGLGRDYLGVELNPDYVEMANERLRQLRLML